MDDSGTDVTVGETRTSVVDGAKFASRLEAAADATNSLSQARESSIAARRDVQESSKACIEKVLELVLHHGDESSTLDLVANMFVERSVPSGLIGELGAKAPAFFATVAQRLIATDTYVRGVGREEVVDLAPLAVQLADHDKMSAPKIASAIMTSMRDGDQFVQYDVAAALARTKLCGPLETWLKFDVAQLEKFSESTAVTHYKFDDGPVSLSKQIVDVAATADTATLARAILDKYAELGWGGYDRRSHKEGSYGRDFFSKVVDATDVDKRFELVEMLVFPYRHISGLSAADKDELFTVARSKPIQNMCGRALGQSVSQSGRADEALTRIALVSRELSGGGNFFVAAAVDAIDNVVRGLREDPVRQLAILARLTVAEEVLSDAAIRKVGLTILLGLGASEIVAPLRKVAADLTPDQRRAFVRSLHASKLVPNGVACMVLPDVRERVAMLPCELVQLTDLRGSSGDERRAFFARTAAEGRFDIVLQMHSQLAEVFEQQPLFAAGQFWEAMTSGLDRVATAKQNTWGKVMWGDVFPAVKIANAAVEARRDGLLVDSGFERFVDALRDWLTRQDGLIIASAVHRNPKKCTAPRSFLNALDAAIRPDAEQAS